jgi:hypothetical protein
MFQKSGYVYIYRQVILIERPGGEPQKNSEMNFFLLVDGNMPWRDKNFSLSPRFFSFGGCGIHIVRSYVVPERKLKLHMIK